ncbi:MAG: hypothetical protein ACRELD_14670 [Longimicrobiales bacterium]
MKRSFVAAIVMASFVGLAACADTAEDDIPDVEESIDVEPMPAPAPMDTMMMDTMGMDTMLTDTGAL